MVVISDAPTGADHVLWVDVCIAAGMLKRELA
jgi:hypothetical protein